MKRDKDLIRDLLLQFKNGNHIDYCDDTTSYHLRLIQQAGWIDEDILYCDGKPYGPMKLNWTGHEVADLLSDEDKWEQLRANEHLALPFNFIIDLLKDNSNA